MRTHVYTVTVNSNMFQGPHHSKASGLDTYNIYGCLQHLAEASHRDWWVGSAYCTPFWCHFVSRGRLLFSAVASCRVSEELHSEICREKRTRPFIWGLHFLLWLPFWTPFRLVAELPLAPGRQFISYKCGVTIEWRTIQFWAWVPRPRKRRQLVFRHSLQHWYHRLIPQRMILNSMRRRLRCWPKSGRVTNWMSWPLGSFSIRLEQHFRSCNCRNPWFWPVPRTASKPLSRS